MLNPDRVPPASVRAPRNHSTTSNVILIITAAAVFLIAALRWLASTF